MQKKKFTLKESLIVVFLLLAGMIVYNVIAGFSNLGGSKTTLDDALSGELTVKECVEGSVPRASQNFLSIRHSLNFIPTGTEHFYLVLTTDYSNAVIVRAGGSWGEQFDNDGISGKDILIRGKVKKLPEDVRKNLTRIPIW